MKKMYTNKPIVEFDEPITLDPTVPMEKRIATLESKVSQISEQISKLSEALGLNSRQIRRANTDITNLTTVVRNR
jgi:uncharacterized coiled-coil protein SlyX